MGNVPIEQFDTLMDKASPWDWKDVEALAKKSGLTAKDVAEIIKDRSPG